MFKKKDNHNIPKDYDKQVQGSKSGSQEVSAIVGESKASASTRSLNVPKPNKRIASIVVVIIVISLFAGWLIFGVYNTKIVFNNIVCDAGIVARYNDVSTYKDRGGEEDFTIDEEGFNNLVVDIKDRQGYKFDPTCQTILLEAYIRNDDYESAQDTYISLKDMHTKHKYVDSNLSAGSPLSAYEVLINSMPSADKIKEEQEPKGGA